MNASFALIGSSFSLNGDEVVQFSNWDAVTGFEATAIRFAQLYLNEDPTVEAKTSGTTGTPKVLALKKTAMQHSARMTGSFFNLKEGYTALLCLPVHYIAGKMMVVRAIELGLALHLVEPTSQPLLAVADGMAFDFCAMVPLQVQLSLDEEVTKQRLSNMRSVIVGGGAVSVPLQQRLLSMPNAYYATYGMTETITHVAVKALNGPDCSDDFVALPGVKIWQDARECLTITAPLLHPEELITNDVIELTDFGRFKWLGRLDNVINTGGVKVMPESVEEQLNAVLTHPYFVAGVPDDLLGEKVVLIIEAAPFHASALKLFQEYLSENLDKFHQPKHLFFVDAFERTESGKIKRKATLEKVVPAS